MQIVHGPRPKGKIKPEQLSSYELTGDYIAQRKYNGDKNTFHVSADRKVTFWNKGSAFTKSRFDAPKGLFESQIAALKLKPGDYWFDSELLTNKVPNTIVLYDVLQAEGSMLIGMSQLDRLNFLHEICGHPTKRCNLGVALQVTENIWLAEHFDRDFPLRYKEYLDIEDGKLIEGLVLRRKDAPLREFGIKAYETDDQIRCRKGTKNYRF